MKKQLTLLFLVALAFVFTPNFASASNFAGVKVVIKNPSGSNFNGVKVGLRSDDNDTYSGGDKTRYCDSDSTNTAGAFVNLNGDDVYYRRLAGFYTGNEYTYGGQKYNNPDGTVYFGNGVNSTGNGGGMGFGFACSCNPLKILISVPSGYYFDTDGDGVLDNGEAIGPTDVTVSKSGLENDSSYTYTFYLGDAPSLARAIVAPATAEIGSTVTVEQKFTHNNDGDVIATAYIRNNLSSSGVSDTRNGTSTYPYSIAEVASAYNPNVSTDYYNGSIAASIYSSPRGYQWKFLTGSGGEAITRGTWSEKFTYTIRNDNTLANKVVGTRFGAGLYPSGTMWALSPVAKTTLTVPYVPTLSCTVEPNEGAVPFVVTVTPVNPDNLSQPFTYNMGDGVGTSLKRTGSFSYTYKTPNVYEITINHAQASGSCSPDVTVTNPANGDGGEVAP